MITLTATSTGVFPTTQGKQYVLSTTGPIAQKTKIKTSYSLTGASGVFNGFMMWDGNFSEAIWAPGGYLKVELVNGSVGYDGVNVELIATT